MAILLDLHSGGSSITESEGTVTEYRRSVLITALPGTNLNANIADAYSQLDGAGATYYSTTAASSNLRLVERSLEMIEGHADEMRCTLIYRDALSVTPPEGQWIAQIDSTVNQIQTARDFFGIPISVSHTYPNDDDNFPGTPVVQGGEVAQYRPQIRVSFRGLRKLSKPALFSQLLIGRMNATAWGGLQRGQWLCTNVRPVLHDLSTNPDTYMVELDFEADFEGWGQDVIFTDPATGKVPPNLIYGVGIKKVQTQPYYDFNLVIPT